MPTPPACIILSVTDSAQTPHTTVIIDMEFHSSKLPNTLNWLNVLFGFVLGIKVLVYSSNLKFFFCIYIFMTIRLYLVTVVSTLNGIFIIKSYYATLYHPLWKLRLVTTLTTVSYLANIKNFELVF